MTWTDIHPKLKQYEGMTPSEVGRSRIEHSNIYSIELLQKQDRVFAHHPNTDPWNYQIDNIEWMEFWKDVYALKDKPRSEWTLDDWFGYRGLDALINWAMIGTA